MNTYSLLLGLRCAVRILIAESNFAGARNVMTSNNGVDWADELTLLDAAERTAG